MNQAPPIPQNLWFPIESDAVEPCPYLEGLDSKLELGIVAPDGPAFDGLMSRGFRRQGMLFYKPACDGCRACIPIRVDVDAFRPSRSQRRVLSKHRELFEVEMGPARFEQAHFEIYRAHARHVSDRNRPEDPKLYRLAFVDSLVTTHFFEFRIGGQLVCVSILDEGEETVSSVYAYWDPEYARYSPGTFSALWELEWARQHNKRYYHLGYWVADCSRMTYKAHYRPHQYFDWGTECWLDEPPTSSD